MNLRSFSVFSAVAMLALGGCVIVGANGTGGSGGTGGGDVGGGGSTGTAGSGGGDTCTPTGEEICGDSKDNDCNGTIDDADGAAVCCDAPSDTTLNCYTCGDLVTFNPCTSAVASDCAPSTDLYGKLTDCTCTGGCMAECGDNVCMGLAPTDGCTTCVQQGACASEFGLCVNDTGM